MLVCKSSEKDPKLENTRKQLQEGMQSYSKEVKITMQKHWPRHKDKQRKDEEKKREGMRERQREREREREREGERERKENIQDRESQEA